MEKAYKSKQFSKADLIMIQGLVEERKGNYGFAKDKYQEALDEDQNLH